MMSLSPMPIANAPPDPPSPSTRLIMGVFKDARVKRFLAIAIARNLFTLASLKTPIINLVLGEGGSGGALAIGMGDKLIMLEYSIYSVISPEACSSILWRTPDETETAAEAMGISSSRLNKLGLVDEIIDEPLGGFHRNPEKTFTSIKESIANALQTLQSEDPETLLDQRRARYKAIGEFNEN